MATDLFGGKQIARQLGLSSHTVCDYIEALYSGFGVHNRAQILFKDRVWSGKQDG